MFRLYFLSNILLVISGVCTANATHRYPFVLPKCCEQGEILHQVNLNKSADIDQTHVRSCGTEGPDVVLLPRKLFPAMSTDLEYVEVELQNLADGLKCEDREEMGQSDIQIEFGDMEMKMNESLETKEDYSFSGENLVAANGSTYFYYTRQHFCISSRTANKTHLSMKTCKQTCSQRSPCIPRCCGGHQSIVTSPPTSSSESFLDFCSSPTLTNDSWNPWTSRIVGGTNNLTRIHQIRYTPNILDHQTNSSSQKNCRLLRFIANPLENQTPLTLLKDGGLKLILENTTEVIEDFCIDGMNGDIKNTSTEDNFGHSEVVVAFVCSPSTPEVSIDSHVLSLPACSCLKTNPNRHFQLLLNPPFRAPKNAPKIAIPVRLTTATGVNGSLECPEGFNDSVVNFKDVSEFPFRKDGSLFLNGSHLDPTQFCIKSVFNNAVIVRTCKEECNAKRPCINRCCSGNTHIDLDASNLHRRMICASPSSPKFNGTEWSFPFYATIEDTHPVLESDLNAQPLIRKRQPYGRVCSFVFGELLPFSISFEEMFKLMTNGDLMEKWGRKKWVKVNQEDYCIEPSTRRERTGQLELTGHPQDSLVWRCWRDPKEYSAYLEYKTNKESRIKVMTHVFMSSLNLIPTLFYVLIGVVYILRKDKEPVFRWSVVCFSISTTLHYWQTIYNVIAIISLEKRSLYIATLVINWFTDFCELYGICWMSVFCFDLWLTITFLTPGSKSMKRMWGYVAFTLILPIVFVGTEVIRDTIAPQTRLFGFFRYGLFGSLASINFILFIATAVKLRMAQKSSDIKTQRKTFLMYLKLFFLMGARFVLEFVHVAFSELKTTVLAVQILGFLVFFTYMLAHPILLFYFLVWNVDTKRYMENNHPRIKKIMDFIDCIGYPARKCLGLCKCCKPEEEINGKGADDAPHNSTHMYVHTKRSNSNPKST